MKNEMQKAREEVVKIEARQAEEEKCKKCGAPVDEDGNFKGCASDGQTWLTLVTPGKH